MAEQPFRLSGGQRIIILTAVLASLFEIVDTSIVNVAIPSMMGNLGATLEDISWVVTGYIIANAIVLPIAGWLGMQIGRKKYYVGCILLFTATSVACGLAPNLTTLIIFRVIQGFAGGALLPTSQALIQEQFPREKAGTASAIYGMGVIVGPTIGPTLGGYLTDHFNWRAIFNINLPLGLFAAFLAYLNVKDIPQTPVPGAVAADPNAEPVPRKRTPIDTVGLMLLVTGIGALQFVLERGQADDWFDSAAILISTIVAIISIPSFIWWELRTPHPVMDLRLFKHAIVRSGTTLMLILGAFLYSLIFMLPVFVSTVLGYNAMQTGMLFIPGALCTAFLMPIVGGQVRKRDPRILIAIGFLMTFICALMMSRFTAQTGDRELFWPLFIRGVGMAFLFIPINTIVLGQFSGQALGQVAGLMNLSRQLGGSIGIAALSTLVQRFNAQHYIDLVSHVSLLNPTISHELTRTFSMDQVNMGALKGIAYRIQKQVTVLSFEKGMAVLSIALLFSVVPLVLMRKPPKLSGPVDAH